MFGVVRVGVLVFVDFDAVAAAAADGFAVSLEAVVIPSTMVGVYHTPLRRLSMVDISTT